jgi:hypothetical protein
MRRRRGTAVIVTFMQHAQGTQPVLQFLTFEGERVSVLAPTDEEGPSSLRLYGVNQHPVRTTIPRSIARRARGAVFHV